MSTAIEKHNLVVRRVINASVDHVWNAWVDPEQMKRWWGPTGFTCPVAEMDVREDGQSLLCMRSPDGQDFYSTCNYTTVVPSERLNYTLVFTDAQRRPISPTTLGLPANMPAEVPHEILFKDLGKGRTELIITEFGYPDDALMNMSRMGLEQSLDKMTDAIEARSA